MKRQHVKYPGWRTMTAAQRYNARMEKIVADANARARAEGRTSVWDKHPHDRPLAVLGLTSYRYRGVFGWIMIGAHDHADAEREAARSTPHPIERSRLQVWDGAQYVPVEATA